LPKILLLIIEDDAQLAEMYEAKFKLSGYDVDIGHDGAEGFDKMKREQPDLVLLDLMMPNLDGMTALKHAKADPVTKDIPIIVLTNLSDDTNVRDAIKFGAAGYIVKSDQTPTEVVNKIKNVLAAKNPGLESSSA